MLAAAAEGEAAAVVPAVEPPVVVANVPPIRRAKGRPWKGIDESALLASCRWPECDKSFRDAKEARKHERVHLKDPGLDGAFRCRISNCDRNFSKAIDAVKHLQAVHGDRKQKCKCGKTFSDSSKLKRHIIQVHAQLTRYFCENCEFSCCFVSECVKHEVVQGHNRFDEIVDFEKQLSVVLDEFVAREEERVVANRDYGGDLDELKTSDEMVTTKVIHVQSKVPQAKKEKKPKPAKVAKKKTRKSKDDDGDDEQGQPSVLLDFCDVVLDFHKKRRVDEGSGSSET